MDSEVGFFEVGFAIPFPTMAICILTLPSKIEESKEIIE